MTYIARWDVDKKRTHIIEMKLDNKWMDKKNSSAGGSSRVEGIIYVYECFGWRKFFNYECIDSSCSFLSFLLSTKEESGVPVGTDDVDVDMDD